MGRRAKSAKGKLDAERACAGKPPKKEGSRVRDLEKRLAESSGREKTTGKLLQEETLALTVALEQQTATSEILRGHQRLAYRRAAGFRRHRPERRASLRRRLQ